MIDIVGNRYRLQREIGHGGMGTVYLARDERHDVPVAIKILRPELAAALGTERFTREIRIAARLQHPNLLPVTDSGEVDGIPFLVMPYVEGETLAERLRGGPLPLAEAIAITTQVADGLAFAHRQGFIHRDVKPSNILLAGDRVLLADFGLARAIDVLETGRVTETGIVLGTVEYMSPEQGTAQPVDGRTDIYALGCVLYEMLAGVPPFTGPTPHTVMARHSMDPVPSLRTVRDTVPPALEDVILKALAKVPADRWTDVSSFREALLAAERPGAAEGSRVRRRPWLLAAGPLLLLLGLAGLMLLRPDQPLDPNRVMVYPLVLPDGFRGPPGIGEDVATMIGHALDGAGPLRSIDGWSELDATARQDVRTLTRSSARRLARARHCGYFLSGRVVARGDTAEVFLELHDVEGDSVLARGRASGTMADAWRQGLEAVNAVLPQLIPGSPVNLAEWRNRSPAAVASFLLGESAFRRVQLEDALGYYRAAVHQDSTFALAALRGAQAASWNHRTDEAGSLVGVALRQPLAPRYRHFALGYAAYLAGRADSAVAELRQALVLDPGMTAAWMQLGETYTHLVPLEGSVDSLAESAFMEAARLDSSAVNLLFHLSEFRLRRGDVAGAAPLLSRFFATAPDSGLAAELRMMERCVREGPDSVDWHRAAATSPAVVVLASRSLALGGGQLPCAMAGFRAILARDTGASGEADGRRWGAVLGLHFAHLARGEIDSAAATADAFIARWGYGTTLYLRDAPVVPQYLERARQLAAAADSAWGQEYRNVSSPYRLWVLGVQDVATADGVIAAAIAHELARRAGPDGAGYVGHLARSLQARLTLARGDSAAALALLRALVADADIREGLIWDEAAPMAGERLLLARLLLARGEPERAIAVANVFDGGAPLVFLLYLPASLELRANAASVLDDRRREAAFRARAEALRTGSAGT